MSLQPLEGETDDAFRARMKASGYKEIRLWTLDPDFPGFREELAAALERIRNNESEREVIAFGEALMADQYRPDEETEAY